MNSSLDLWLADVRLQMAQSVGGFVVSSAMVRPGHVELELARGGESVIVQVRQRDLSARALVRTPSFDVSYAHVPSGLVPAAVAVTRSVAERIAAVDAGGCVLPRQDLAEPAAAPAVALPSERRDFVFVDVDAADLARYPDAMHQMFERKLDVMIIRDVFPKEQMARVAAELERPDATFRWHDNIQTDSRDHMQPYNLGMVLIPTQEHPRGAPLEEYFANAAAFRRTARELFKDGDGWDFEARIEEVLRGVAGGRRVEIPRGPAAETYSPATIRAIPPGAQLAVHVGNYFKECDAYWHLKTFVDVTDQLSYFVPIATPEGGGEIEVFSLEWHHRPLTTRGDLDVDRIARESPSVCYRPGSGDMFLFDGGYWYHRVRPVVGRKKRWTIGGFVTISTGHDSYYYWS